MIPDCTLVTCCFDMTKYNNKCRNTTETIGKMKSLLETPCYLVIFTHQLLADTIKHIRDEKGLNKCTTYVICEPEELDSFKYLTLVKSNREKYHPTKDERTCAETHLLCCSKFDLVLKIIHSNPFKTSKFGWIDANVGENFSKICTNYTNNMLLRILANCSETKFHLQILNVNDKKYVREDCLSEYYSTYRWVVCGCLFITGKEVGVPILEDLQKVFIKHTVLGYGHGEEMFYLEILDKYYDSIERSYGDYQDILNNFLAITTGINYIKQMANKYMTMGYHKECVDCCSKVIRQYEHYNIPMTYPLYFDFLFYNYVSLFYCDNHKAKEFVKHIMQLIDENPYVKVEYEKNKHFYDEQFKFSLSS
ncbi:MAG: WlaTC/HtrL family glycosyltransferase [Bacteroidota bacterium]